MQPLLGTTILLAGLAACHPAKQDTPTPRGGDPGKATVHQVLTDATLVGLRVEVVGTCLGYSSPTIAKGSPPLTRSDWQLEDQGEAVWVSGPMPEGCTATEPAQSASAITAYVAQDTLEAFGGAPAEPRRYLVR
jgi:hypothetical protein